MDQAFDAAPFVGDRLDSVLLCEQVANLDFEAAGNLQLCGVFRSCEADGAGWEAPRAVPADHERLVPFVGRVVESAEVLPEREIFHLQLRFTDGSRLQADLKSGQRLVSRSGAMWRWDGLRANPEDTPSATALVLAQRNRLLRLQADLETAVAALDAAKEAYTESKAESAEAAEEAGDTADEAAESAGEAAGQAEDVAAEAMDEAGTAVQQ